MTDTVNLADAPTIASALEGLMAIPTCRLCDDETEPFTDLCVAHLTGPEEQA